MRYLPRRHMSCEHADKRMSCGSGFLSAELARHCEQVIGANISPDAITIVQQNNKLPWKVELKIGDAQELGKILTDQVKADIIAVRMAITEFNNEDLYSQ